MAKYEVENAKILLEQLASISKPLGALEVELVKYAEKLANEDCEELDVLHFFYGDTMVNFRLLSSYVLECDKKILKINEERNLWESIKSLRIAGCPYLNDACYLTVISDTAKSLVRYQKDNKNYIIDYGNNIIMEEGEYLKIFDVKVIEEIPARELSYLSILIGKDLKNPLLPFFLTSYSDMKEDIKRHLPSFAPHFYGSGVHEGNHKIFSLASENLFLVNHEILDVNASKNVIYKFTIDRDNEDVIRCSDNRYQYLDYTFYILSDYIGDEYRGDCESTKRDHRCVEMGISMLWYLGKYRDKDTLRLVMGNIPVNEYDSTTHFWVEFKAKDEDKYYALDYTMNIIMDSDDYIRLRRACVIRRIPYGTLDELFEKLKESSILVDTFDVLYFAEDILRDLHKNKTLFK